MSSEPSIGIRDVGQVALVVQDVERATAFYRDILGLPFLFAPPGMAFFQAGGVRLMLSLPSSPEVDHPASILFYTVPDIHASHATLVARGVEVVRDPHFIARMPDHDLWISDYRDSESNLFALMCEVRA